jgi:hypothetical protein
LTARAVAQRNGDSPLSGFLPDDVFIKLSYDFTRSEFVQRKLFFFGGAG